jgi:hypothetical protein
MAYFDATTSFDAALAEVDHLLELAKRSQTKRHDYLTYLKAALVLLGAKFEAFAENIIDNYVDRLVELAPKTKHISRELRVHSTTLLLSQCMNGPHFSAKSAAISNLESASALWHGEGQHSALTVSNKFSYGKHGSGELRSLFQRIGIPDILTDCHISTTSTDTMIGTVTSRTAITADIDSFTNIRNNIIHSDSNPSNITYQQIHEYKEKLWEFGYAVDLRLERELVSVEAEIVANP